MRCAIYCRLSREDAEKQTESESIQNQKSMLLKYAAERDWTVSHIFCDEDYSGADRARPDFNRMLQDAQAHCFDIVLCKTQSRFTRDMELVEQYLHGAFPRWGIRFVAVADNVDTAVKGNKKARQINGLINEWYLEDLSENIRMVLDSKRRDGQYIGGFPLYGYRADPADKHHLLLDDAAAETVRRIFQWALAGEGSTRIAARLNAAGILAPTQYKQAHGLPYRNGRAGAQCAGWNKNTVARMLCNEMYLGDMVQGRVQKLSYKSKQRVPVLPARWVRVPNTHAAIIDRAVFARVQELRRGHTRACGTGTPHPLAGCVRCAACGGRMSCTGNTYKGVRRTYLRCRRAGADGARCARHSVRLDALLALLGAKIRDYAAQCYPPGAFCVLDSAPPDRALLARLIDSVEVGARSRETGEQEITVHWRF